jgi:hypothetical protein
MLTHVFRQKDGGNGSVAVNVSDYEPSLITMWYSRLCPDVERDALESNVY